ncbi:MAG: hypothetical protein WB646_03510 [Steroidobacteraceae bacterium]
MLAKPLQFPGENPRGYAAIDGEPSFDPERHLALQPPRQQWSLADFGYTPDEIRQCASPMAVAGPFRVLSPEGVAATRSVALALRAMRQTSDRTATYVAGGVYRSKFMRDLCSCPQISQFLSAIAGCELITHSMPSLQLYINYAPDDVSKAVDTWHVDSIGFDYVLLLNDPASFSGGEFQFFRGTAQEAAQLLGTNAVGLTEANARDLPVDRVTNMAFPDAGCAIFQQGNKVVHRATRLQFRAERITVVPGFVARDLRFPDPTGDQVTSWGEPGQVAEFARHKAWLARSKLDGMIERLSLGAAPTELCESLRQSIADVTDAIGLLEKLE